MAKRAKAKKNKVKVGVNDNFHKKPKYISKADRAKLEAEQNNDVPVTEDSEQAIEPSTPSI